MTFTVPTVEPDVVMAGETWHWTIELSDFPGSESWTITYYLAGASIISVAATLVSGSKYDVVFTAANTAAILPGRYVWQAIAVSGTEKHVARPMAYQPERQGVLTVLANIATATAGTLQTHAEKTLAVIETEIYNRMNSQASIEAYAIAGRQVSKIPIDKLLRMRSAYQAMVRRERNPGTIGTDIAVIFGSPS